MKSNEIYVIDGKQIGTHSKAVYHEDNRTVFDEIETLKGSIGTSAGTNVNFITDAYMLVDDLIFEKDALTGDIKVKLNTKLTLNRIMAVCYSNGGYSQVSFIDGTVIPNGQSLMWSQANGFTIGSTKIAFDTVLVGLNYGGRITAGIIRHIWEKYNKYTHYPLFEKTYNVNMTETPKMTSRTLHSMVTCENELITLECYDGGDFKGEWNIYDLDTLQWKTSFKTNFKGIRDDIEYNGIINLRLVTADYNEDNECLLIASGTADGSDTGDMQCYIMYDLKTWKNSKVEQTFENTPHTTIYLERSGLFTGQGCAKCIWSETPDIIYFTTSNLQYCHKILLGTGTTQLEHGVYAYDVNKRYNGTFKVIKTYSQETPQFGNKDVQMYDGALYYTVKDVTGGYKLYRTYLMPDGGMKHDLFFYNPITNAGQVAMSGSPEGVVITKDGKFIGAHATFGKFYSYQIKS